MPTLSEEVAARKKAPSQTQQDPARNPELDAKIDAFIAANRELYEKMNGYSKEYLVRQKMLSLMEARAYRNARDQALLEWVEQNPEIKERVAERVRHVPADRRERATLNVAKEEAQRAAMRGPRP